MRLFRSFLFRLRLGRRFGLLCGHNGLALRGGLRLGLGSRGRDDGRYRLRGCGRLRACRAAVLDLHIERRLHDPAEQRRKQAVCDGDQDPQDAEQHAEIRDFPQQGKNEKRAQIDCAEQDIRAEHLALVAHRLLLGDLDGVGGLDVVARHKDVGHEAVFIHTDDAEHDPDDRNERPQEDPELHPRHAAQNAKDPVLFE